MKQKQDLKQKKREQSQLNRIKKFIPLTTYNTGGHKDSSAVTSVNQSIQDHITEEIRDHTPSNSISNAISTVTLKPNIIGTSSARDKSPLQDERLAHHQSV